MIAVVVENVYALLTLASIYATMPEVDPFVIYVGKPLAAVERYLTAHGHDSARTGVLPSYEVRTLHIALRDLSGEEGCALALRSGVVVLHDPRPRYPDLVRMGTCSTALSRKYMYERHIVHTKAYRALGINPRVNRNTRVTYHRLDVPYSDERYLTLTTAFCFSEDPLLGGFMNGREVLKHAYLAEQAAVVDFFSLAINPKLTVMQAYGAPLEYYSRYAEMVAESLPAAGLAAIRRNGRISQMVAKARSQMLPIRTSDDGGSSNEDAGS